MDGSRFGYCGFVPHTPTELAFARAEENDALHEQVMAMLDDAFLDAQMTKGQTEPMQVVSNIKDGEVIQ